MYGEDYKLTIRLAQNFELDKALLLLKEAALRLQELGIDQWQHWIAPEKARIDWIKEEMEECLHFVYLDNSLAGMFRYLKEDLLYWGRQPKEARYVHSLTVGKGFGGISLGKKMLEIAENMAINEGVHLMRLDCKAQNKVLCNYYEGLGYKIIGQVVVFDSVNNLFEKEMEKKIKK